MDRHIPYTTSMEMRGAMAEDHGDSWLGRS